MPTPGRTNLAPPMVEPVGRLHRKIRNLLNWDEGRIESFVRQLVLRVEVVEIEGVAATVPTDPNDTPILATLIASGADVLVTGDSDLLALSERYSIETPAQLARRL